MIEVAQPLENRVIRNQTSQLARDWLLFEPAHQTGGTALDIKDLENKIDELISLCDEFERKQAIMEADRETWLRERTRLLEKNDMAKNKVEAMIMRLKGLEQD